MNTVFFYLMLLCAFGMLAAAVHIGSGSPLPPRSRLFFVLSALLIAAECLGEAALTKLSGHGSYAGIMTPIIVLEFIATPCLLALESIACGMRRMPVIAGVLTAFIAVIHLAGLPSGMLYYVTATGYYSLGPYSTVLAVLSLLEAACMLSMLYLLGRRFRYRKPVTLIALALIPLLGNAFGTMAGVDSDSFEIVAFCIVFLLLYSYYAGLVLQDMQNRVTEHNVRTNRIFLEMIQALAGAVDAKDRYTNGHSHRVAEYAVLLARELGWDDVRIQQLRYAALMHDVGKIGIPDSVLNKPSRLNDIEFDMIKAHTILGARIIPADQDLPEAWDAARSHHERFDGSGYPDGLSGDDIPEIARVIGIADAFDAMNSDRIYRTAIPRQVIRAELEKGLGSQFDPEIGAVFLRLYDSGALDAIGATARQDALPVVREDEFEQIAENLFRFLSRNNYALLWEQGDPQMEGLFRYLENLAGQRFDQFGIAVFSIAPNAERTVTDAQQAEAVATMLKVIRDQAKGRVVCGQLSSTQLAAIFRRPVRGEPPISEQLREILLSYYKMYESEPFDISYRLRA